MTKTFDSALALLARREHSVQELYAKLVRRGFSPAEIQEALDKCQELDLQSDVRFADNYTRSRIRQGYGPLKIAQELKSRGVDSELIQARLREERDRWIEYAQAVWQKKAHGQEDLSFEEVQKQQRFLLYRGFSPEIIRELVM